VASEYKVELDPAKIVQAGQVFSGDTELTVRTDKFLVEEVTVQEEPALEGKAKVVYRGRSGSTIRSIPRRSPPKPTRRSQFPG
jgi:hypothetical protein